MSRHRTTRQVRSFSREPFKLQRLKERASQSIRRCTQTQRERIIDWFRGLRIRTTDNHWLFARVNALASALLELFGLSSHYQTDISRSFERFNSTSANHKRRIRPTRRILLAEPLEPRIVLDGSEPYMVRDINVGSPSSYPYYFTEVGNISFFGAVDGNDDFGLWKSDGTAAGTMRVKEIHSEKGVPSLNEPTNVSGTLYFVADDGVSGFELWKSDGTEAGTVRVKDIRPGIGSSIRIDHGKGYLTNVSGTLYFSANDGTSGYELWKSDGTEEGTVPIKDIWVGSNNSNPRDLTNVSGTLFFGASEGINGRELWKSDGTEEGTVRVKDIWPGSNSSDPSRLTSVGDFLYFRAKVSAGGNELWKSDGTEAGTVRVKDIRAGSNGSYPEELTNVSGTLYFMANDHVEGYELWKSDGTEQGTVRVKDIWPGTRVDSSWPTNLTNMSGILFFVAMDETDLGELWKSDGTEEGTVRVKDIRPGMNGSYPQFLTNVAGTLYFNANDGTTGKELWKSDGTETGTVLVKDIWPGIYGSDPRSLGNVAGRLYFRSDDSVHGSELWVVPAATAQVVDNGVYYKGSSFASGGVSNALDTGKSLAKEGAVPVTLSYANLINSSRGINGLMFDIANLRADQLTAADFDFQVSPVGAFDELANPVQDWQSAPSPTSITIEAGSPSRVVVEWPDSVIANRWLRITIKANTNTGLATDEVYYVGHLLGETTGASGGAYSVETIDIELIRNAVGQTVDASSIADIDKNGRVAFSDIQAMRLSVDALLTNITIPAAGSLIPGANLPPLDRASKDEIIIALPQERHSIRSIMAAPIVGTVLATPAATPPDRGPTFRSPQPGSPLGMAIVRPMVNRSGTPLELDRVPTNWPAMASSKQDQERAHAHRDRLFESWDYNGLEQNQTVCDLLESLILQNRSKLT